MATYIQYFFGKVDCKLSELNPVSKMAVWMAKKFEQKSNEKEGRNLIAVDETVVKADKKRYYVFSAMDIERNEVFRQRSIKLL